MEGDGRAGFAYSTKATCHLLVAELENVEMQDGEDPKFIFYVPCRHRQSEQDSTVQIILRQLPECYSVKKCPTSVLQKSKNTEPLSSHQTWLHSASVEDRATLFCVLHRYMTKAPEIVTSAPETHRQ